MRTNPIEKVIANLETRRDALTEAVDLLREELNGNRLRTRKRTRATAADETKETGRAKDV
jgi:hypothetical protein